MDAFYRDSSTRPDEDDWAYFEDADEVDSSMNSQQQGTQQQQILSPMPNFPPQLHPAVSLGLNRVSSCYFSLGSEERESVADLLSQFGDEHEQDGDNSIEFDSNSGSSNHHWRNNSADILYHDILMNVFTFLNAQSLASFSETARRPNFEVFYFLQLQLQRALLVVAPSYHGEANNHDNDHNESSHDHLSSIAGVSCLSRLASLDPMQAQEAVNEYLQSNSTLRTMPLSHSVAYMRHVLRRHGFHNQLLLDEHSNVSPSQALASAALLVTVIGAASLMAGEAAVPAFEYSAFGTELPNMLFGMGFVGSIMKAAQQMTDGEQRPSMRETAEQVARRVQELPSRARRTARTVQEKLPSSLMRQDSPNRDDEEEEDRSRFRLPSLMEMRGMLSTTLMRREASQPMLSNPYDHLPKLEEKKDDEEKESECKAVEGRKIPSGCVGAYFRAIHKAATSIKNIIKERRKAKFLALSQEEQRQSAIIFLDACSSDGSLSIVKELIHQIDVDGFYMGSDGSEACALHTAAFHGASKVLEFLCQGIADGSDPDNDGGLCEINRRDNNGWTALHFAAGANAVLVINVLARHGAELSVEANNGYTPVQWAARLSNDESEEALKRISNNRTEPRMGWMSSQPLTTIANRFFALIPSH